MQRAVKEEISRKHIGASVYQQLRHAARRLHCDAMQRRAAIAVGAAEVRAGIEEELHGLEASAVAGVVQRRGKSIVLCVRVLSVGKQLLHHAQVVAASRQVQR